MISSEPYCDLNSEIVCSFGSVAKMHLVYNQQQRLSFTTTMAKEVSN